MTFADLQIRVTEAIGQASYASGVAGISTDPNVRDKVKRSINDAALERSRFREPNTGRSVRWSWLEPDVTLTMDPVGTGPATINGDRTQYALPINAFGFVGTPAFRYPGGFGDKLQDTNPEQVIAFQQRNPTLVGPPQLVAIDTSMDVAAPIGSRRRRKLIFFPIPDVAYVVRLRVRVSMTPLVDDAERGPWTAEMDLAIVDRAIALCNRNRDSFERDWEKSVESFRDCVELDRLSQAHGAPRDDFANLGAPAVTVSLDGIRIL